MTTSSEWTHILTEPRLGKVGWYDEDTGQFEYDGFDEAAETVLRKEDISSLVETRASLVPLTGSQNLLKQADDSWIPYQGPKGGEGWQHVGSGEVRYQQQPPGEVAEGYEEDHWKDQWPTLENAEWEEEDIPHPIDMNEGDHVIFVNRNGDSEVGNVVGGTFVRREGWDQSKTGVKLEDGREITEDEIAAYADMTSAIEPPELEGGAEWEDAPGAWSQYDTDTDLVHYQDEDGDTYIGVVIDYAKDRGAIKVQTSESFEVIDTDKIAHRAKVDEGYNVGYELLDSPFEEAPEVPFSLKEPEPDFAEWVGADTEDVWGAFSEEFGSHLIDNLEEEIESGDYDPDDPNDLIRAITNLRDTEEWGGWPDFKWELRGRANGISQNRVERIIAEAFDLDVGDAQYNVRQKLEGEERNQPEEWLKAAADYAMEEDSWVSLSKLQEAVYDWSGDSVPFSVKGIHGFDGKPEEIVPLSETPENSGISEGAMFIADWPDGNRAYITRIRDAQEHGNFHSNHMESSVESERAMTGYNVQKELNSENDSIHYPDHEYRYDSYLSVASAPEDAVLANDFIQVMADQEDFETPVDREDFFEMCATAIIAGNDDLHANNVMADPEGNLYPVDLDFSGHDMTRDRNLYGGIGKLVGTARSLGIEVSEQFEDKGDEFGAREEQPLAHEILARAERFAEQIDSDEVRSANPMYAAKNMGDNVARNYEAVKNGELEL